MDILFLNFLFFMIPIAAIAFFIICLCLFISARKTNIQKPGSVDVRTLKFKKVMLILSSIIAGIIVAIVIGMIILLSSAIKYM